MLRLRDFPEVLRRSTATSTFLPVLDGLRFLAIIPVVLQHMSERVIRISEARHLTTSLDYELMNAIPSGRLGVDLFFVISGLIISYPFIYAHAVGQPLPSLKAFYLRRTTRLEPPYFLVMIACYLFVRVANYIPEGTLALSRSTVSLETSLIASLAYSHGLLLGMMPMLNPPAWSLEIEIQFYLIAPLLLFALSLFTRSALALTALISVFVGTIIASNVLRAHHAGLSSFLLVAYLQLFVAGILVNILQIRLSLHKRLAPKCWDAIFLVVFFLLYYLDKHRESSVFATLEGICFLLLVSSALNGEIVRQFLSRPWIFTIGGMCYTIYLIHLPILHVLAGFMMRTTGIVKYIPGMILCMVLLLPILFVASVIFYLLVEKPCMNPRWPLKVWRGALQWTSK